MKTHRNGERPLRRRSLYQHCGLQVDALLERATDTQLLRAGKEERQVGGVGGDDDFDDNGWSKERKKAMDVSW